MDSTVGAVTKARTRASHQRSVTRCEWASQPRCQRRRQRSRKEVRPLAPVTPSRLVSAGVRVRWISIEPCRGYPCHLHSKPRVRPLHGLGVFLLKALSSWERSLDEGKMPRPEGMSSFPGSLPGVTLGRLISARVRVSHGTHPGEGHGRSETDLRVVHPGIISRGLSLAGGWHLKGRSLGAQSKTNPSVVGFCQNSRSSMAWPGRGSTASGCRHA